MGKTERGAIYLAPEKTSPYAFYQYWINVADDDAGRCLRMLTELPREEIEQLDAARRERPHLRESQKRLAEALTRLVHGEEALAAAQRATAILFGAEIDDLSDQQLAEIFADVPSRTLPRARLEGAGLPLVEALVEAGLARSKSEARRILAQGGAYVNNRPRRDVEAVLTPADLVGQTTLVLRTGKKHYALLRFV
jgi:tyrosyl-tRNA synthetase